ncbi:MAG: xylose isomerase [Bacteroidetes bacterium RBG_13_43_22]|nr:MAG: xylose isomerase [Bacteroidetes bacterium RBG_13_43_22]
MKSRRQFIKVAGTGILAAGIPSVHSYSVPMVPVKKTTVPDGFEIGMAGYTFTRLSVEKTIEIMKRAGVTNLSLKDFHMPLNSTQEKINEVIGKFKSAGINVYTVGVIYMKTQESVDQAFEYAKMAGVKMIVGAPDYELLPHVEKKIKEYDFRLAIHNHGPDNTLFPNAADIWNHVKDLDPRIGICIDIGHTIRDGQDPASDIMKYKTRIFDLHIKDVDKASKEGQTIEMGRGIIDIPKVVEALRKISYTGKCSLEFEKDMNDPLAGIAESIGYFRGVMACK